MATAKKAASKAAKTSAARTASTETASVATPAVGSTQDVVVTGRVIPTATGRAAPPMVVDPDSPFAEKKEYSAVAVKAIKQGYYGHKRRRVGEVFKVFVHDKIKELPSWMIYLEDAEKGQDEGTRGLHFGTRLDDEISDERKAQAKALKKSLGKGAENVVDPTIVNDAVPLTENGNERRPDPAGNESVV